MFAREIYAGLSVVCDQFNMNDVTLLVAEANISILDPAIESVVNVVTRDAINNTVYFSLTMTIFI
jgi:hypothetical protein